MAKDDTIYECPFCGEELGDSIPDKCPTCKMPIHREDVEIYTDESATKSGKLLNLLNLVEKKGIFWEPNTVGGVKGIYTSKASIDWRIDINPKPKGGGFSWMIGRAASDRFLNQGESKTEEDAKKDAVKFLKAMEARSLA